MAKSQKTESPRIFISHAWEDKALVRRLEAELKAAGAEVWVDHAGIRGGDILPEHISIALDWCNTLLLIWSKAAASSHWVKLEWTNAITLKKRIIPCPIDKTPLPSILASTAYIDFANPANGLQQLLAALQLEPPRREAQEEPAASPAGLPHSPLISTVPPAPQYEPIRTPRKPQPPSQPVPTAIIQLRHTPIRSLPVEAVQQMLREKDFFDKYMNESGKGIKHQYERTERHGAELVIDHATGLTWQQGGSESSMLFKGAENYIQQLNDKEFAGFIDWRLPTLEEAMSLMEPKKYGELYLDPIFDRTQWWIWTADFDSAGRAWYVDFGYGLCDPDDIVGSYYVRAVRP
ncbi:MAG: TIR domain-containing protein [candidate division KSB1 bacterium]|nr:TIR domain-containing protein [candidate division KSB1 bacterium]